jgi:hypothetical protein
MAAQRQDLAITQPFNFVPTTLKEAQEYATIFANSGLCPESYRGRPNDILIVWQLGKEIGLDKMQSLRTLGCINGMPFAYGDGQLALVKRHRDFIDMHEWFEGELEKGTLTAFCTITRRNQEPVTQKFSIEDAKRAGLWGKKGTWTLYPRRMLQHRARGFAAKDAFPDALYGLMSEDEAIGVAESATVVEVPKPKGKGMSGLEESLGLKEEEIIIEGEVIGEVIQASEPVNKLDELKELIASRNVTKGSITVALKKFGVETIDQLTDEMIDKWSTHLKNKEIK